MKNPSFPLKELSIAQLYCADVTMTYEIPVYQRNYAWEEDEIRALVQDVYDAFTASPKSAYYIGTLVCFDRGEDTYEVIDGQQRLTTIYLILQALGVQMLSRLTYRARRKSKETLARLDDIDSVQNRDYGIADGYGYAKKAIDEIVTDEREAFMAYFLDHVHIVHYRVPKDVDLNHYFEVMNSRGEQLERHEIVKAMICNCLCPTDVEKFGRVWEACSNMDTYVQQKYAERSVFGRDLAQFPDISFDDLPATDDGDGGEGSEWHDGKRSIADLMASAEGWNTDSADDELDDKFEPIIDFSNFLLIVLKLTRMSEKNFSPVDFMLDDKALIREFRHVKLDEQFAKTFAVNLLKTKFLLDNYTVHHTLDSERAGQNPWQLERYVTENGRAITRTLAGDKAVQDELVQLLSMFEVTFTPRQRKNYLFYCLVFLFKERAPQAYLEFLRSLADDYFRRVYLCPDRLNSLNNRPKPNSFDYAILKKKYPEQALNASHPDFVALYGDGHEACRGIQSYVFNYTDYRLWRKYVEELRGQRYKENSPERRRFFEALGCGDFDLNYFDNFYFSRTRKTLEHFYPRSKAGDGAGYVMNWNEINCFGNYAIIGFSANSSGSNWDPKTKLDHYTDSKYDQISVASLKFRIMMQMCADNTRRGDRPAGEEWNFDDVRKHQAHMLAIVL